MTSTVAVAEREEKSSRLVRPTKTPSRSSLWLRLSIVAAVLAMSGSVAALVFEESIYGHETADWAAQSVGQDIANLVAFPVMLVAAFLASRGSMRWFLVWMGLLAYSAYTYAIYAFALHFGPLFLAWVAVFGLSVYSLIGAVTSVDARTVRDSMIRGTGQRFASGLLIGIGSLFTLMWLSETLPPMLQGSTPETLREVGLVTNPVHVLDLALLLPALIMAGVLLRKDRPFGYVLAPVLLVATFFLAFGIVSLMLVSASRGIETTPGVGVAVGTLAVVEAVTAFSLLQRVHESPVPSTEGRVT